MRVVIWGDMEGIGSITQWDQVNGGAPLYEEGRRLYTEEINAAVRGARRARATSIVAVDGHGAGGAFSFNSWIKEALEPGAEYVFGHRWSSYVEPFRAGCDALVVVGAHAMAGTADGVLSHTVSSASWYSCTINGRPACEMALMAATAGSFGVPCIFASGDAAMAREAREWIGESLAIAQVKKGITRYCAQCLPPADSRRLIEDTVCETLMNPGRWPKPLVIPGPVELRVEYMNSDRPLDFVGKKGVTFPGPRTVVSTADTYWEAWDQYWKH